jgi:hypothetical protein
VLGAELRSQASDMNIDGAGAAEEVIAPHFLKQLGAAEHLTRMLGEVVEQLELLVGQCQRAAPEANEVCGRSIRRGTFTSVTVLIKQIRDYIDHWNTDPKPFQWTATADEILAKVKLVQTNIKKLVDNNAK